jgi:hypothetical protein
MAKNARLDDSLGKKDAKGRAPFARIESRARRAQLAFYPALSPPLTSFFLPRDKLIILDSV